MFSGNHILRQTRHGINLVLQRKKQVFTENKRCKDSQSAFEDAIETKKVKLFRKKHQDYIQLHQLYENLQSCLGQSKLIKMLRKPKVFNNSKSVLYHLMKTKQLVKFCSYSKVKGPPNYFKMVTIFIDA